MASSRHAVVLKPRKLYGGSVMKESSTGEVKVISKLLLWLLS